MELTDELLATLRENGYTDVKVLNGKVCGLHDYITTRGICVGLDEFSVQYRYCYQNRQEASREFAAWDGSHHPGGNWIKLKGFDDYGNYLDELNPEWSRA